MVRRSSSKKMRHPRSLGYCLALTASLVYDRLLDVKCFTAIRFHKSLNLRYTTIRPLLAASEKIEYKDNSPNIFIYRKPRQTRRASTRKRKRRNYWTSIDNLRHELEIFWKEVDAPLNDLYPNQPPPIPNEYLLNFFERNDLRWGIAQMGGRETVSHLLDGADIVPGKWKDAKDLKIVKHLVPRMQQLTRKESNQQTKSKLLQPPLETTNSTINELQCEDSRLISVVYNRSESADLEENTNKTKTEFWTKERAVQQL